MAYNLIVTDEMDKLLENCVNYIFRKLKNEQAASHLLDEVEKIYLENYVDKIQQLWGSLNGTLQLLTKLNEAKISIKDEGTISADDIEKKLGL